jgi:hypothetical protein
MSEGFIMYRRAYLIIKNKLWNLDTETLIYKVLDKNIFISSIAKEELLSRDLENINIPDEILRQVILKLSVEQLYQLVKNNDGSKLANLASIEFNKILEDAENNYREAFFDKVYDEILEGQKPKLRLLKK